MVSYLHKLLQLKYPVHVNAITMSRAEELLQEHCGIALDYQAEIRRWASGEYYEANVKRVQLPFVQPAAVTAISGLSIVFESCSNPLTVPVQPLQNRI